MRKVGIVLLASLIVMLTMSLMFTCVVYAGDAVEIGGKIYYLEKGDLLFYESLTNHIGMYSGNGKFVDAHPNNTIDGKKDKVKKDQTIKTSRFDKPATQCYSVKTTQTKRNAAVDWAEGKHGKDFDIWPSSPCDAGDNWYCSELVYCAYKDQGITFGDESGRIWPSEIISDSDVESTSQECPAGSPNTGAYYAPGTTEDGCCEWSGQCFDGNQPSKCSACYGGSWHSGWWCEEGECVPEASTLVLFATGLLCLTGYLGLRRKEN